MNISDAVWPLLGSALSLVLAVGGAIIIPMVRKWLAAKVGVEKSNLLFDWADIAVRAAEQILSSGSGADKYAYVLKAMQSVSDSHNIKVDTITLQAAIESAVHTLKTGGTPEVVGNVVVTPGDAPVIVENKKEV
jgi:molecular chaperone DnaK (HSP70)